MKVIPIISAAGGVGKTTLSLMLAYVLSSNHYNVLLIDMDPTAGLTLRMFGDLAYQEMVRKRKTLIDLINDSESNNSSLNIKDYVVYGRQARNYDNEIQLYSEFYNVAVLPPGEGFDEFFAKNLYMDIGKIIWNVFNNSNINEFDIVIIDTAPFFDERYTLIALYNMDKAVAVLRPTLTDINRTNAMITKISRAFKKLGKPNPSFILVFNFEYNRYKIEAKTLEDVLGIMRFDENERGRVVPMNLTDKARRVNDMLMRSLKELINNKYAYIDFLKYVMPYDVKYSDETFPQINSKFDNRRLGKVDNEILTLTLKHLVDKFNIKLDTVIDIDNY